MAEKRKCAVSSCTEKTSQDFCPRHWTMLSAEQKQRVMELRAETPGTFDHSDAVACIAQAIDRRLAPIRQAKEDLEAIQRRKRAMATRTED